MITRAQRFVEQVYWPDLLAIAGFYKEWAAIGGGVRNYLAVRRVPRGRTCGTLDTLYFPRGIILDKDLTKVHALRPQKVKEYITSSWYEYSEGDDAGLHPWEGETKAQVHRPADARGPTCRTRRSTPG